MTTNNQKDNYIFKIQPSRWCLKHDFKIYRLAKKRLESFPIPETNYRNGSGDGINCGNFTFPQAQHNPVNTSLYFNVLQY